MKQNAQRVVAKLHSAVSIVGVDTVTEIFPHKHSCYEFAVTVEDHFYHIVNGEKVDVTVGDVVMLRPSDVHSLHTTSESGHKLVNVFIPIDSGWIPEHLCDSFRRCLRPVVIDSS